MNNLLAVVDGSIKGDLGTGAYVSVVAIALVFLILALIIAITYVVNVIISRSEKISNNTAKVENTASPSATIATAIPAITKRQITSIDKDLDASIAVLVSSIDFRSQVKDDIKVKSVYEIVENKPAQIAQPTSADADENAMAAVLVASIDYRNEIKKDIKVKSVKEIK